MVHEVKKVPEGARFSSFFNEGCDPVLIAACQIKQNFQNDNIEVKQVHHVPWCVGSSFGDTEGDDSF